MIVTKICVIGMGYVGLPTALMLAVSGHTVIGCDIKGQLIEKLKSGTFDSPEKGLNALYHHARQLGSIVFCEMPMAADAYILALPTPIGSSGRADVSAIHEVARHIAPLVKPGNIVVLESTVPPGTTKDLAEWIGEPRALYAHVPERVLPGNLLHELKHNGRIIGGLSTEATRKTAEIYHSFVAGKIRETEASIAEIAKLMENTYRDVNIALANEFAKVCDHLGISAQEALTIANEHPRVNILSPGLGVGGHCIAVDPWFIVQSCPEEAQLIRTARQVNDAQPVFVLNLLKKMLEGSLLQRRVAVLGLAYKADVDDARESPSRAFLTLLESEGAQVRVHDPLVSSLEKWQTEPLEALFPWADAVVVATGHSAYYQLEDHLIQQARGDVRVLDAPGILDTERWEACGISIATVSSSGRVRAQVL